VGVGFSAVKFALMSLNTKFLIKFNHSGKLIYQGEEKGGYFLRKILLNVIKQKF
jgi:hypothetical protein